MHRPGALETATLASYVAAAVLSIPASRRLPDLRHVAVGLVALAAVDVLRLWTRGSRVDVALFFAWPLLAVAPTLPVLARRRLAWGLAAAAAAGAAGAAAYPLLGPCWLQAKRATRFAAAALAALALSSRLSRDGLRRLSAAEAVALVCPASGVADLLAVWTGAGSAAWVARVGSLATNAILGAILLACSTTGRGSGSFWRRSEPCSAWSRSAQARSPAFASPRGRGSERGA
jgi:hypothetical protein